MFISKTKLLMAVLAVALIVPATAYGTDAWSDVPDAAYEHAAVTWAKANSITNGCDGGTNFCPAREVTRRENIAFTYRYDQEIVQPALADIESDIATNAADIAGQPTQFWVTLAADGTIASSSPGVDTDPSVTGPGSGPFPGIYQIGFLSSFMVEDCFAIVSIANTTLDFPFDVSDEEPVNAIAFQNPDDSGSIGVITYGASSLAVSFTLHLSCPVGVVPGPGFGIGAAGEAE